MRRAASLSEIPLDRGLAVNVAGIPICLVRQGSTVKAVRNVCSHEDSPLDEGFLFEGQIECPLHGSVFDLETGIPVSPPAVDSIPVYAVKVEGDEVLVNIDFETGNPDFPPAQEVRGARAK